jgi:hypothetical protein
VVTARPIRVPTRVIPASARSPPPKGSIVSTARALEADGPCCWWPFKPCTCTWCGCIRSAIGDDNTTSRKMKIWDNETTQREKDRR